MFDIKELRQRQHDLKAEGRKILEAAKAEDRDPTDNEEERLTAIEKELEPLANDIDKTERQLDRERAFTPGLPAVSPADVARGLESARRVVGVDGVERDPALTGGFNDLADFALSVFNASPGNPNQRRDSRLDSMFQAAPTNFHQEQGANEGYMVPTAFREEIWSLVFNDEDLLSQIDGEPTSSNTVGLTADEVTPWGATGIQAKWRSEASQMAASKLDTEGRLVKLHELYAFATATDELLEDAPRLNARLTRGAASAIRWKASDTIPWGTGAGQPLGYMNAAALVTVAKESGQAAATIVPLNVTKMFSRLLSGSIIRSVWYANTDIFPQLATMTLGDQPIWTPPASGFINAPGGFLFGRPIRFTEHAETLGTVGDLNFVDLKGYYGATKRSGIKFDTSIHLFFDFGLQAFRWTFRFGGEPFLEAPVSPKRGAATKSHFVTLATRA